MLSDLLTKSSPKYSLKLRSTGDTVHFRPFLVREEKALLIALDEDDPSLIMKSIADIISSCCEGIKNPLELPIYDVENIFLHIRSKSVGEVITLNFQDDDTGEIVTKNINISDIKLSNEPEKGIFKLNDEVTVHFRYPVLKDFLKSNIDLSTTEGYYDLITMCLMKIQTPEQTIDATVYDSQEVKDFLESMNKTQFNKILSYFTKMPKLRYTVEYKNSADKAKTITLEGMQDFFGLPSVTLD
tara:strand:- start:252 stop:977 length:726 start_codon:yes stop_codon:yes gene_type:complete